MKNRIFSLIVCVVFFIQCNTYKTTDSIAINEANPSLVHLVLLDLKDDLDEIQMNKLLQAIQDLEKIDVLQRLEIGAFTDLDDPRALSQYELIFSMAFKNKKDYDQYQKHPLHLELKKIAGPLLSAAPATYDYSLN